MRKEVQTKKNLDNHDRNLQKKKLKINNEEYVEELVMKKPTNYPEYADKLTTSQKDPAKLELADVLDEPLDVGTIQICLLKQ